MWTLWRVDGLEAASIEGCGWAFLVLEAAAVFVCVSEKTQSGYVTEPHGLTASLPSIGFCSAKAGSSRESLGAEAQTGAASLALYSTRLRYHLLAASRRLYRETLHGYERRLSAIGGELRRTRECVGLSQHIMGEAEALLSISTWWGSLPSEVAAVALL
jgi:hypothetical protein